MVFISPDDADLLFYEKDPYIKLMIFWKKNNNKFITKILKLKIIISFIFKDIIIENKKEKIIGVISL